MSDPLTEIWNFAYERLREHGLYTQGWHFGWDRAVRRYGACHLRKRKITLSKRLVAANKLEESKDTVLHEIAHALRGAGGHDAKWRAICVRIGARPQRCWTGHDPIPKRYVISCRCTQIERHRISSRIRRGRCGRCRQAWTVRRNEIGQDSAA